MAVQKRKVEKESAKQSRKPSALRFYEGGFVLNSMSGMFYRLTPAAGYLLRSLDSGARIGQLPELVQNQYGVDHTTAVRDVELLLNQLVALGLLDRPHKQ